jgi:hypothetical protein
MVMLFRTTKGEGEAKKVTLKKCVRPSEVQEDESLGSTGTSTVEEDMLEAMKFPWEVEFSIKAASMLFNIMRESVKAEEV